MQRARNYDRLIGLGTIAIAVFGLISAVLLRNWALIETAFPVLILGFVIYLFYRLVIAVEHLAYDS